MTSHAYQSTRQQMRARNESPLRAYEGRHVYSAADALLKGTFESEREIGMMIVPNNDAFEPLLQRIRQGEVAELLGRHGTAAKSVPDSLRALTLALQHARSSRNALAMIASSDISLAATELAIAAATPLQKGSGLCILIEDDPTGTDEGIALCPRVLTCDLALPTIEVADVAALRESIEQSLRLSRSSGTAVSVIVHSSVLHSWQTLEARPNRNLESVDVHLARGRRTRPRWTETRDPLRVARRLEVNVLRALPSPGEVVPVGFITIGPADPALRHVVNALHLRGRVPILHFGLLQPLDTIALSRFLERCEQVVILEPRPGSVERMILAEAETLRSRGQRLATIWGQLLPAPPLPENSDVRSHSGAPRQSDDGEGRSHQQSLAMNESLHPSQLVRRIVHLLHGIRPSRRVASRLIPPPPPIDVEVPPRGQTFGKAPARAVLRRALAEVDQWLRTPMPEERNVPSTALAIDGVMPETDAERVVPVEIFDAPSFARSAIAAVRQAARDYRPWVFIVLNFETPERLDLERLVRGVLPGERTERLQLLFADLNDRYSLQDQLQNAVADDRVTVLLVHDAPSPQHDVRALERELAEVDQYGFEHAQQVIHAVDRACLFPQQQEEDGARESRDPRGRLSMRTEVSVDRFARPAPKRIRLKVQPLLEQLEVVRSRAPAWIWRSQATTRLELPSPLHRKKGQWRAHLAGCRGPTPGVAAEVLLLAGRNMGYDVTACHDTTPIEPGVRAWTQVLFTRPAQDGAPSDMTPLIPYGEADLLLGVDRAETIRAVTADDTLQVAHPGGTCAVVNTGRFGGQTDSSAFPNEKAVRTVIDLTTRELERELEDYAIACRSWFQTDRLTDLAMLGVAFQRGFVPVSLEAIENAVQCVEQQGFGRSCEAFEFGRTLAVERRLLSRPRNDVEEDIVLRLRRMVRMLRKRPVTGASISNRFERLLQRSLTSMPGLSETAAGRRALRHFVMATGRCLEWGGFEYASRYAELIMSLYRADRGDKARAITRDAILPLAEVMLIHDPIYVALMATSLEQRHRLRHTLNVKNARGDRIERRYLTRVELVTFDRRFRADVRTSDWPARIARMSRHVIPIRWRGTRAQRERRSFVMELLQRAIYGCADDYDRWRDVLWRLHLHAVDNRLRDITLEELKMLIDMDADETGTIAIERADGT